MKQSSLLSLAKLREHPQAVVPSLNLNLRNTDSFELPSGLMDATEIRTFAQRLEAAEAEARSFHEIWKARRPPDETLSQQPDGAVKSNRGQYNYDVQSADEEILSNVREVQRFNDELVTYEEEARATSTGIISSDEPRLLVPDIVHALDLITSLVEVVREPLIVLDNSLRVIKANRAFYRTFSHSETETETRLIYELARGAWDIPALKRLLEKVLLDKRAYEEVEVEAEFPVAGRKTIRLNVRRLSGGEMILMSIRDVTPRRRTEVVLHRVQDELRQGQKMEAIGRLAGGIAHDFNNILTGILGFSELLMDDLDADTDAFFHAAEIKKASERAAALTQQLLAFSRRQVLRPQVLSMNTVVLGLTEMLRRLIGDNIQLTHGLVEGLGSVNADPGQISQVILNLALNGRDAMPQGGTLSIRTENTRVEGVEERVRGLPAGDYVRLIVIDTGIGMDQETQQHLFEPFYTTKPQGSGTGLGLATVFGIVEQSGGSIQFTSELGFGTTFWIDFPRVEGYALVTVPSASLKPAAGNETILLVEDDELVRELVILILKRQGYTVFDVGRATEALEICRSHPSRIDLILTDLLMPGGMDGRELAEEATRVRPGIRVLLMSGYTTDALVLYGVAEGAPFLQKPFTQQQLAGKVREVLDMNANSLALN